MGSHGLRTPLHNNRNNFQSEKTAYRMGKDLCQLRIIQKIKARLNVIAKFR